MLQLTRLPKRPLFGDVRPPEEEVHECPACRHKEPGYAAVRNYTSDEQLDSWKDDQ